MENACFLETKDSVIGLDVSENILYVTYLSNIGSDENKVSKASEFALPSFPNGWEFDNCTTAVSDDRVIAVYHFKSSAENAELNVSCSAHPGTAGPFEFVTEIINKGSEGIRITPECFAAFDFVHAEDEVLTSIKKESGMAEGYTHYDGRIYKGSGIYTEKINLFTNKSVWLDTFQNWNENGYLPMAFITDNAGGIYSALEWSSGRINIKGGINGTAVSVDMFSDCTYQEFIHLNK